MLWALSRIYVLSFSLLSTYFAEQAPSQDHKSEYIKIDTKNRLNWNVSANDNDMDENDRKCFKA